MSHVSWVTAVASLAPIQFVCFSHSYKNGSTLFSVLVISWPTTVVDNAIEWFVLSVCLSVCVSHMNEVSAPLSETDYKRCTIAVSEQGFNVPLDTL